MLYQQPPLMVMMCIYHRNNQSYISLPVIQPGKEIVCESPGGGWTAVEQFYAVNPMFIPIPSYFRLICAKRSMSAEKNYMTLSVTSNYDPYNLDSDCVYFLTWTQPTPYTTPLYIYESGDGILVSFEKKENMTQSFLSPLFVLTAEPKNKTIFPGDSKKWFKMDNGVPQFRFINDSGRCIPDPDGGTLEQCAVSNKIMKQRPMSLLDILESENKKKKGGNVLGVFQNINTVIITIILCLFIISIGLILFFVLRK